MHTVKDQLSQLLQNFDAGSAESFDRISWNANTAGNMKARTAYSAGVLGSMIFEINGVLIPILPSSSNFGTLLLVLKNVITPIHMNYEIAVYTATSELQSKFSSQFIKLTGADADWKGHHFEHLRQRVMPMHWLRSWLHRLTFWLSLLLDKQTHACGEPILTNNGSVMQSGRKCQEPIPTLRCSMSAIAANLDAQQMRGRCHCGNAQLGALTRAQTRGLGSTRSLGIPYAQFAPATVHFHTR